MYGSFASPRRSCRSTDSGGGISIEESASIFDASTLLAMLSMIARISGSLAGPGVHALLGAGAACRDPGMPASELSPDCAGPLAEDVGRTSVDRGPVGGTASAGVPGLLGGRSLS